MGRSGSKNDRRRSSAGRGRGDGRNVAGLFHKLMRDQEATMRSRHQALRFLEGMGSFASKVELLNQMTDRRNNGERCLSDVLGFMESPKDIAELLAPLIQFGVHPDTSKPLYRELRNKYLYMIYLVPMWKELVASQDIALLPRETMDLLCLFLSLVAKAYGEVRANPFVATIAKELRARQDIKQAQTLCTILLVDEKEKLQETKLRAAQRWDGAENQEVACWVTDRVPPGDRHNNDHLNFRDISIVPTAEELRCQIPPYLPLATDENRILDDPVVHLLDKNFRLLREDAISTMRQCLTERKRAWHNARIIGLDLSQNSLAFKVQLDPPSNSTFDWSRAKELMHGSVVAFLDGEGRIERTGTVTVHQYDTVNQWLKDPDGPIIGVTFEDEATFDTIVKELVLNSANNNEYNQMRRAGNKESMAKKLERMETYELLQVSKSFFSYQPTLKALQKMDHIPFSEEILQTVSAGSPGYIPGNVSFPSIGGYQSFTMPVTDITEEKLMGRSSLDESQARAIHHTLSSRVSLIQGPPGTGKTFIGGLLAQIIRMNTDETILCVCYTNHALDQFLEHLMDSGETSIVRLGGRTKSPRLSRFQLRELARAKGGRDNEVALQIKRLDARKHRLREELEEAVALLDVTVEWKSPSGGAKGVLADKYPHLLPF